VLPRLHSSPFHGETDTGSSNGYQFFEISPVGQRGGGGATLKTEKRDGCGEPGEKNPKSGTGQQLDAAENGTKGAGSIHPINTCVRVKDLYEKKCQKFSHPKPYRFK
jgi:hypothetical protein